jgi:hypothetical protein
MMTRIKHWLSANLDLTANVLLGIGAFVVVCGWRALDFTNIKLMMAPGYGAAFDRTQIYLAGWIYRSEPFSWDIFRTYSINPPDGIAGTATDFNPLWSLLFKFLGLFGFDPRWQVMGLLTLLSFVLTGIAASYIFRHVFRERRERWLVSVASLFFIFSPMMISRMFVHSNYITHWIFLFAFVLYLNNRLARKEWILGAVLLILSVGVSPYFLPMTCVPLGALALKQLSEESISPRGFIYGAVFWSAVIAVMVLLLVPLDDMQSVQRTGWYGHGSLNLNALFNPIEIKSNIIPHPLGQSPIPNPSEGDNYLGFGLLVLLVMLIPAIRAFFRNHSVAEHRWLLAGCGVLLFFALSFKINLYNFTIFEYDPGFTRKFGDIFRSTGRFFWPCWFFLAYFLIWLLFKSKGNKAKYILVALAALQLYDLYPTFQQKHENIERWSEVPYRSIFQSAAWDTLFERYRNVFIVGNIRYIHEDIKIYEDLWYMIPSRKIKVNEGCFTQVGTKSMERAKAEENLLKSGVISARFPENTIFIFISRSLAESYVKHAPSLADHVRQLDGIYYLLWDKSLVEGNNPGSPILKWDACDLPVVNAQVNRETCEVTSLVGRPGFVTYGPHIYLPQGNYRFEIEYTGASASATDVGAWDIYTPRGRLGMGALPNTHGNRGTYRGTLSWPSEYVRDLFEIRTFVQPDARLTIHGIKIERID